MDNTLLTICYADVFDFPLTQKELSQWMIFGGRPTRKKTYYTLQGREQLVRIRKSRSLYQSEKWKVARIAAKKLLQVPSILLVGVTGGLAMNNAGKDDDVDFFIITAPRTLWITRLLATLAVFSMRRKRGELEVADKVCLNMFITGDHLEVIPHDLFAAHEILQMKPLWDRGGTYKSFLAKNRWVRDFLPQAPKQTTKHYRSDPWGILKVFEPFAKMVQLWYMNPHRTSEKISDMSLQFHPNDARVWVKRKLAKRLKAHNTPLDNIFSGR